MKHAKDCICEKESCKEQAVVFIQGNDPDLTLNIPFCREHADDYKIKMMFAMYGEITADDIDEWLKE